MTPRRPLSVGLVTLGCPKNLVDSEVMMGTLLKEGYVMAPSVESCDVAVINTCAFIEDSKKESIDNLLDLVELKKKGRIRVLVLAGCLPQKYGDEIKKEIPEVDAYLGTGEFYKITRTVREVLKGKQIYQIDNPEFLYDESTPRLGLTPVHSRYVKVSEGCNHSCTFCIIPQLRGRQRSRSVSSLIKEAQAMGRSGAKEINLIAQDLTSFGKDLGGRPLLPDLIRELDKIKEIHWIRLLYTYPTSVTDEMIKAIRESKKVCHYLDMPLQHASNKILKAMGRGASHEHAVRVIEKFRKAVPDSAIRTTFITGFPGETEKDFKVLEKFISETRFDKVGTFIYSDERDAASYRMKGKVPKKIKEARQRRLMELQQKISLEINKSMEGKRFEVLVDEALSKTKALGRTYREAPGIDGNVILKADKKLKPGDLVQAIITKGLEYDLEAKVN